MSDVGDMLYSPDNLTWYLSKGGAQWSSTSWILPVEECRRLLGLLSNETATKIVSGTESDWEDSTVEAEALTGAIAKYINGTVLTCLDHAPVFTRSSLVRASVLGVLAILSLLGNAATIFSIERSRKHSWSTVYTLILHLSVSDLFVTVFCIAGEAGWICTVEWAAGNLACKVFKFMQMFSLYLSTFVLVLIAVDRFIAVRYPMRSLTAKRCNRYIGVVWIISCLLSIPQLFIFHVEKGPFYEDFYQCVTYGFYSYPWQEQLYTTFSLVCMFVLPLVILVSTYVSTIITIARSEKVFKAERGRGPRSHPTDVNRCRLMRRAKIKSLRISVVIVVAFVVWWTPYYTMMIIFMFLNPGKRLSEDLQSGIFFFGMSNSLVNPLIYGAFHLWRPSGHKSSYRSTGFNSVNFSREGSTRRSTATNVSILNRTASRKKATASSMPPTAASMSVPRLLEEEAALVASPNNTPLQQLDELGVRHPRHHHHHHHHMKRHHGRSRRHRSSKQPVGGDGNILLVSSHRRKSNSSNGMSSSETQRDSSKSIDCEITINGS
ncbi:gonadotropin-releasing hormone II receptor-like [Ischnura elegans]|uniref:gonadotropin-releasing hormone II receptor-like n=1 Tax=Ischnura elegans TaxID=197161 RepID=UPI001ED8AF19|nr:gonadotropin-releasing hormone II receptor-like [Ischnura elegans]